MFSACLASGADGCVDVLQFCCCEHDGHDGHYPGWPATAGVALEPLPPGTHTDAFPGPGSPASPLGIAPLGIPRRYVDACLKALGQRLAGLIDLAAAAVDTAGEGAKPGLRGAAASVDTAGGGGISSPPVAELCALCVSVNRAGALHLPAGWVGGTAASPAGTHPPVAAPVDAPPRLAPAATLCLRAWMRHAVGTHLRAALRAALLIQSPAGPPGSVAPPSGGGVAPPPASPPSPSQLHPLPAWLHRVRALSLVLAAAAQAGGDPWLSGAVAAALAIEFNGDKALDVNREKNTDFDRKRASPPHPATAVTQWRETESGLAESRVAAPPSLLDEVRVWMRAQVAEVAAHGGPEFVLARCDFTRGGIGRVRQAHDHFVP
jgi:hypothetical protein